MGRNAREQNGIDMLRVDHQELGNFFANYHETRSASDKDDISKTLMQRLRRHMLMEEQLFFPAASKAMPSNSMTDATVREMSQIILILDKLQRLSYTLDGKDFDLLIAELEECFDRHVRWEEKVLSAVEQSSLDAVALGRQFDAFNAGELKSSL